MKKTKPIKNTWYDWLANFIAKPKRKREAGYDLNLGESFRGSF